MDLNAAPFLFFFMPFAVVLYWIMPGRTLKNFYLVLASLVFYAFGQLQGIVILLISFLVNWVIGILVSKGKAKKFLVFADVLFNVAILFYYKYLVLAMSVLGGMPEGMKVPLAPIGVSFFTFKAMSYVIDICRGGQPGKFLDVLLYISFFPQITSGPITRYRDFGPQLAERKMNLEQIARGFRRFTVGLGKKLLLVGSIATVADAAFAQGGGSGTAVAWLGAVAYSLQLYFDFSGYSDMSIGLSAVLGFEIPENFRYPYIADSLREFWKRWHISLSSWFQDYLYIPLGGGRKGRLRKMLNQFIVFAVSGLWHGANWTFLAWGAWHGIWNAAETALSGKNARQPKHGVVRVLGWIYTILLVVVGFVIFRAADIGSAWGMICSMFVPQALTPAGRLMVEQISPSAWLCLALGILGCTPLPALVAQRLQTRRPKTAAAAEAGAAAGAAAESPASNPFVTSYGNLANLSQAGQVSGADAGAGGAAGVAAAAVQEQQELQELQEAAPVPRTAGVFLSYVLTLVLFAVCLLAAAGGNFQPFIYGTF